MAMQVDSAAVSLKRTASQIASPQVDAAAPRVADGTPAAPSSPKRRKIEHEQNVALLSNVPRPPVSTVPPAQMQELHRALIHAKKRKVYTVAPSFSRRRFLIARLR